MSVKTKKWHTIHTRKMRLREATHEERLARWKEGKAKEVVDWVNIKLPATLDLAKNYKETVATFNDILELVCIQGRHVFLDFIDCKDIAYEACLVLGAVIDRCLKVRPKHIFGNYPPDPTLTFLLGELGFYKLINVKNLAYPHLEIKPDVIIVPMESRSIENKTQPRELYQGLKPLFENIQTVNTRKTTRQLYRCLSEAMLNVVEHAYPDHLRKDETMITRWWSAGFSEKETGRITVVFFDQGMGIPNTIGTKPTSDNRQVDWKTKITELASMLGRSPTDSEKIVMAMELGNTSKEDSQGKGKGLPDTKRMYDNADGVLRLLSYKGDYALKIADGKETGPITEQRSLPLQGTLITWHIENVR